MWRYWFLPFFALASLVLSAKGPEEDVCTTNDAPIQQHNVTIATLVTTSDYVRGALVLAESLNRQETIGDRILLYVLDDERSDLTQAHLQKLKQVGWKLRQLVEGVNLTKCETSPKTQQMLAQDERLEGMKRYWGTCGKFGIFGLEEYEAVVYIDADSIVLGNINHLFDLPSFAHILHAPQSPPCFDDPPVCNEFYGALLAIKPLPHIQKYLHQVAQQNELAEGELPLLIKVFAQTWQPLAYGTLVAQTDTMRPLLVDGENPVDWSQILVYDFSGPPEAKPWATYDLQQAHGGDSFLHGFFGKVEPESRTYHNYLYPQLRWNEHYEAVTERLLRTTATERQEQTSE